MGALSLSAALSVFGESRVRFVVLLLLPRLYFRLSLTDVFIYLRDRFCDSLVQLVIFGLDDCFDHDALKIFFSGVLAARLAVLGVFLHLVTVGPVLCLVVSGI